MTNDRTTKALLLAIALGLWVNVAGDWLKPVVVEAQSDQMQRIANDLRSIAYGVCVNEKLC